MEKSKEPAKLAAVRAQCDKGDLCKTLSDLCRLLRRLEFVLRVTPGSAALRQGLTFYRPLRRLVEWFNSFLNTSRIATEIHFNRSRHT